MTLRIQSHKDLQFVLVGAQKTSTFWLAACIRSHPDIFISSETTFLTHETHKTYSFWQNYFSTLGDEAIVGEYANSYLAHPKVPEMLARANPNLKIIVSTRNPLEQTVSAYHHDLKFGVLGRHVRLRSALGKDMFFTRYVEMASYSRLLKCWLQYFPASQIYLFSNSRDSLVRQERLDDLFSFLDASPHRPYCLDEKLNVRTFPLFPSWFRNSISCPNRLIHVLAWWTNFINLSLGKLCATTTIVEEDREAVLRAFRSVQEREKLEELVSSESFRGRIAFEDWSL